MKLRFVYLLGLSATILVVSAAYFSVTGFVKLFSGSAIAIIILISGLEFAKLIVTSFLYKYWVDITILFKTYLLIAVSVLMVITSSGLYGFLSSSYSVTADKLSQIDSNVKLLENKKNVFVDYSNRLKGNIEEKSKRCQSLSLLRVNQEVRLDSLYKKGMIQSAKRTEQIIKDANDEILRINSYNDTINKIIQTTLDSVNKIEIKIIELNSNDIKGDIGPLKYIATLTGKTIDTVVNFFILLLVFISDPLAVCLVIATNKVLKENNKDSMKEKNDNGELELIDKILNKYCEVCKKAVEDDNIFNTFKSHQDVLVVLEHTHKALGQKYLELITKNNGWLLDIQDVWNNDKYGSPKLENFKIENGLIRCSPTTLQYLGVVSNLVDNFGPLDNFKIVEIGGGYGGQCKIIQDVFETSQYTIIDLEEVTLLQEKYLNKFGNVLFTTQTSINYKKNSSYDLVISNYALSEFSEKEQNDYIDNVLLHCKRGYITCNKLLSNMNALKEKFKTLKIVNDIEGERHTNYIITW